MYQHSPGLYLRLFPLAGLVRDVEQVSGHLDLLPPDTEALARTVMAQTARFSSHPLLFGPPFSSSSSGIPAIDLSGGAAPLSPFSDLREFGKRRASVCAQLRESAVKCVWEKGIMAKMDCEENAGTCWILSRLVDDVEPGAGTPYLSAATTQFRLLAAKGVTGRDTKWRFILVSLCRSSFDLGPDHSTRTASRGALCSPSGHALKLPRLGLAAAVWACPSTARRIRPSSAASSGSRRLRPVRQPLPLPRCCSRQKLRQSIQWS